MKQNLEYDDNIFRQKIINVISKTEPNSEQKQRIFENVINNEKREKIPRMIKVDAAIIVICILLGISAAWVVQAATAGKLFHTISRFCKLDNQEEEEIVLEALELPNEVYASNLAVCTKDYLVLANERAMLIYERNKKEFTGMVDLQEIQCNFFDADTIETHIFIKDQFLYIFNDRKQSKWDSSNKTGDGKLFHQAYVYDLALENDQKNLTLIRDRSKIKQYQSDWKLYKKEYVADTFDTMQSEEFDLNEMFGSGQMNYSENCIKWTDADGNSCVSCLGVMEQDCEYTLYTLVGNNKKPIEEVIFKGDKEENNDAGEEQEKQEQEDMLPPFEYSGKNEIMRTACIEALKQESHYYLEKDSVFIPVPLIYKTLQDGDELVVFCNLWGFGYYRNGNMLVCCSGGSMPARLKLKLKKDGTYKVTEFLKAGMGADFGIDIEKFCKEYSISDKIYYQDDKRLEKQTKKMIKMYVNDHDLPIQYYKTTGDNPIELN